MSFSEKLKELRKAKGLTQDALSRAAGLAHSTVPKLEQGGIYPSWETAVKLANALDVSLDAFKDVDDAPAAPDEPAAKKRRKK